MVEWEYTDSWGNQKDASVWPKPVRTYAIAVTTSSKQYDAGAHGYMLCEFELSPFGQGKTYNKEEPGVFWRSIKSGYTASSFATSGPEDVYLDNIHNLLSKAIEGMQKHAIVAPSNEDVLPRFDVQVPTFTGLKSCANYWEEEGEDAQLATTMKQIMEQFNQTFARIEHRVAASPEYIHWSTELDENVKQLVELINQPVPAPRRAVRPK